MAIARMFARFPHGSEHCRHMPHHGPSHQAMRTFQWWLSIDLTKKSPRYTRRSQPMYSARRLRLEHARGVDPSFLQFVPIRKPSQWLVISDSSAFDNNRFLSQFIFPSLRPGPDGLPTQVAVTWSDIGIHFVFLVAGFQPAGTAARVVPAISAVGSHCLLRLSTEKK